LALPVDVDEFPLVDGEFATALDDEELPTALDATEQLYCRPI
jgi:hypothetical protein